MPKPLESTEKSGHRKREWEKGKEILISNDEIGEVPEPGRQPATGEQYNQRKATNPKRSGEYLGR